MTADGLRRLADVVDAFDDLPIDIDGAQLLEADGESIRGQLTVAVPNDVDVESIVRAEAPATTETDESETLECDFGRCEFTTESERGLSVHKARSHTSDEPVGPEESDDVPLKKAVENTLRDEGELPASEIKLLTDSGGGVYKALSQLETDGVIDSREDPDDGRRTLYRITDEDGTSTEDDTERESEARSVDLEEDAADDSADHDNGTDVQEETGDEDDDEQADDESDPVDTDDKDDEDPFVAAAERSKASDETSSGTATEDDTPAHESESEPLSEARTVDLEADAADDDADRNDGDDVQEPYARCGECDADFAGSLEFYIHRTEVHDVPQSELGNLEAGEFETIIEDADSLQDIADTTGWSSVRTLRVLGVYGLKDVVGGDVELSDLTDFEFDGVVDHDLEDTDDDDQDAVDADPDTDTQQRPVANDGGAVAFSDYSGSSGTETECQNCGSHVDKQFAKVFEPEKEGAPRCCPNCEDLIREGDGTIRKADDSRR